MSENDQMLASLQGVLNTAIRAGDAREESIARVNIACAYLQLGSPQAGQAFEDALSAVHRAQNTRSEGILSMAFAPFFLENGNASRALELAQRGEEVMRQGRIGHRVLANIQLARVLYAGFSDPDQAGQAVDAAVTLLGDGEISNPTDRQVVVEAAGQTARAALDAGDMNRALALMRIVDPAAARRLEQQRPQPNKGLTAAQREDVSRLYAAWQSRFAGGADARIAKMSGTAAELLKWDTAKARKSGASKNGDAVRALVERVQAAAADRTIGAAAAAARLPLKDDDVVFVVTLAGDERLKEVVPGWAVFEIAGAAATDPSLVGRCFRLAAAIGSEQRPPAGTLALLQRAEAALARGADDALQAEVTNEMAVCYLNLADGDSALKAAKRASTLASQTGQNGLERMARGNIANALLRLQRVKDALDMFESLERDQKAAGEREMAQITRQNIEGCRAYLAKRG